MVYHSQIPRQPRPNQEPSAIQISSSRKNTRVMEARNKKNYIHTGGRWLWSTILQQGRCRPLNQRNQSQLTSKSWLDRIQVHWNWSSMELWQGRSNIIDERVCNQSTERFLYTNRAIDGTMHHTLNKLCIAATKGTQETQDVLELN